MIPRQPFTRAGDYDYCWIASCSLLCAGIDVFWTVAVSYSVAMKTNTLFLTASLIALLAQPAVAASPFTPESQSSGTKSVADSSETPVTALKKAMPAAEVRQIMGLPVEIKPMKAPNGKAEIWVYRRELNERAERVQVGAVPITVTVFSTDGKSSSLQTIGEDVKYANVRFTTEETVELLMFNDHFLTGKISRQEIKHYD